MNENDLIEELMERIIRIESRLCQLMLHQGMEPSERKTTKHTWQKGE